MGLGWRGERGVPACGVSHLPTASLPAPRAEEGLGGHLPRRASLDGSRAAVPGPGVAGGTPRRRAGPHAPTADRLRRALPRGCRQLRWRLSAQQQALRGGETGRVRAALLTTLPPPGTLPPPAPGLLGAGPPPSIPQHARAGEGGAPPAPHTPCTHASRHRRRRCKVALSPAPARRP